MGSKPRAAASPKWNVALAERLRVSLGPRPDVLEKKMFGGLCFMVGGHMTIGINGESLMARVGPDAFEASLTLAHARPMDFTGRPLRGFIYVDPAGTKTQAAVAEWVKRCLAFTESLPKR